MHGTAYTAIYIYSARSGHATLRGARCYNAGWRPLTRQWSSEWDAMPLYEFRCTACGATFEQRLALAALGQPVRCPHCGALMSERLVSLPAAPLRCAGAATAGAT